jgi:hypothetical protein
MGPLEVIAIIVGILLLISIIKNIKVILGACGIFLYLLSWLAVGLFFLYGLYYLIFLNSWEGVGVIAICSVAAIGLWFIHDKFF